MNNEMLKKTKEYWQKSPIFDYEVKEKKFTREYYGRVDGIRLKDNNPLNLHLFHFEDVKGKKVLDVGCGTGFLVRQYARNGAITFGVDLTEILI